MQIFIINQNWYKQLSNIKIFSLCKMEESRNYCRVCFQDYTPLKKLPCACKGSLSYMHDYCLNEMLHVKMENQKEDVPDYIHGFSSNDKPLQTINVTCEICLHEINLQKQCKLNWQKLTNMQMEIYFILFGITCLSMLGWNIAMLLLRKAYQESSLLIKMLYLGAYIWIIGVILYVILEPVYSQIRDIQFKIKETTRIFSPKKLKQQIQSINKKQKRSWYQILCQKRKKIIGNMLKMLGKQQNRKIRSKQKQLRSRSKPKNRLNSSYMQFKKIRYFQI